MPIPKPDDGRYRFLVIDQRDLGLAMERLFPTDEIVIVDSAIAACLSITTAAEDGQPFDVIVCSVANAKLSGTSLVDIARTGKEWPVFLYAAAYFEIDEVQAAPAADGLLVKPFTSKEVEDLVWRVLVERDRARDLQYLKLDN